MHVLQRVEGPELWGEPVPGRAWADYASDVDEAHAYDVECSGVGYCNEDGRHVREGSSRAACETLLPYFAGRHHMLAHGQCVTSGWAASHWDGRNLRGPMWSTPIGMRKKLVGVSVIAAFLDQRSRVDCPGGDVPRRGARRTKLLGWNAAHQKVPR